MENFKDGNDYLMFIKESAAATAWLTVACVTSNGLQLTAAERAGTTKCTEGNFEESKAGRRSWTMSASGKAINDTGDADRASFNKLATLWKAGTTFPAKFVGVNDATDITRGSVYITSLSKTAELDNDVTFELQTKGVGEPLFTPEA